MKPPREWPEQHRVQPPGHESAKGDAFGVFLVPLGVWKFACVVSGGDKLVPWEHVSVSIPGNRRTPTWEEMDHVKRLFWRDDETVVQIHVPRADHVNLHPYVLHLWRPLKGEIPRPPRQAV